LSASAGFDFEYDLKELKSVLSDLFLITPNWNEIQQLSNSKKAIQGAEELSAFTHLLLKGGHNNKEKGKDYLFFEGKTFSFNPKSKKHIYEKHGSGCVLSSAIAVHLARGYSVQKSILKSKRYIEYFLASSEGLLGHHKF